MNKSNYDDLITRNEIWSDSLLKKKPTSVPNSPQSSLLKYSPTSYSKSTLVKTGIDRLTTLESITPTAAKSPPLQPESSFPLPALTASSPVRQSTNRGRTVNYRRLNMKRQYHPRGGKRRIKFPRFKRKSRRENYDNPQPLQHDDDFLCHNTKVKLALSQSCDPPDDLPPLSPLEAEIMTTILDKQSIILNSLPITRAVDILVKTAQHFAEVRRSLALILIDDAIICQLHQIRDNASVGVVDPSVGYMEVQSVMEQIRDCSISTLVLSTRNALRTFPIIAAQNRFISFVATLDGERILNIPQHSSDIFDAIEFLKNYHQIDKFCAFVDLIDSHLLEEIKKTYNEPSILTPNSTIFPLHLCLAPQVDCRTLQLLLKRIGLPSIVLVCDCPSSVDILYSFISRTRTYKSVLSVHQYSPKNQKLAFFGAQKAHMIITTDRFARLALSDCPDSAIVCYGIPQNIEFLLSSAKVSPNVHLIAPNNENILFNQLCRSSHELFAEKSQLRNLLNGIFSSPSKYVFLPSNSPDDYDLHQNVIEAICGRIQTFCGFDNFHKVSNGSFRHCRVLFTGSAGDWADLCSKNSFLVTVAEFAKSRTFEIRLVDSADDGTLPTDFDVDVIDLCNQRDFDVHQVVSALYELKWMKLEDGYMTRSGVTLEMSDYGCVYCHRADFFSGGTREELFGHVCDNQEDMTRGLDYAAMVYHIIGLGDDYELQYKTVEGETMGSIMELYDQGGLGKVEIELDAPELEDLVGRFVRTYNDVPSLSGRVVAMILHGIGTPLFPRFIWRSVKEFWQRGLAHDFGSIMKCAHKQLHVQLFDI